MSTFRITYDGPALQAHTMDVRDLAPALLALGDLCEESGRTLFGESVRVRVDVRASFRTGSFGIDLSVSAQLAQQLMAWLSGDGATAVANAKTILEVIGIGGAGLIGLIQWLRGRRITRVETVPEGRRLTVDDGECIVVEERVIMLFQRRAVREALAKVVEPIEREGIERLALGDDDRIGVIIERAQAPWFHAPPPEDVLLMEEVRTIAFSIVSLSFREDNKWRLHDGQNTVFVTMADRDFLDRVDRNLVRFAKGDILLAETRVTQWQTAQGLRTEYTIVRVQEHRQGTAQIELPLPT